MTKQTTTLDKPRKILGIEEFEEGILYRNREGNMVVIYMDAYSETEFEGLILHAEDSGYYVGEIRSDFLKQDFVEFEGTLSITQTPA